MENGKCDAYPCARICERGDTYTKKWRVSVNVILRGTPVEASGKIHAIWSMEQRLPI